MLMLKESFINRVIKEGIVDTRKYRYVYYNYGTWSFIKRIERTLLGTTAALDMDNWQYVLEWSVSR